MTLYLSSLCEWTRSNVSSMLMFTHHCVRHRGGGPYVPQEWYDRVNNVGTTEKPTPASMAVGALGETCIQPPPATAGPKEWIASFWFMFIFISSLYGEQRHLHCENRSYFKSSSWIQHTESAPCAPQWYQPTQAFPQRSVTQVNAYSGTLSAESEFWLCYVQNIVTFCNDSLFP